jgi:nitrite reductase/ring-hydroxylating ferredoxin subunit
VGFFFGLLGFIGLGVAGYLGGTMVYAKRLGVNHAVEVGEFGAPAEFVPVMMLSELQPNQPTKAMVGSRAVVLVKSNGRVYAMGETCSHEGGPLSEGMLKDDCLECPWHGSCFRLEDGHVLAGPAVFPNPVFEIEVRNGQIYVGAEPTETQIPVPVSVNENVSLM